MGNLWRQVSVLPCCPCAMIRNCQMVSENRIPHDSGILQNAVMVQVLVSKNQGSELEPTHEILGSELELVCRTLDSDGSWWSRERSIVLPIDSFALEDPDGD